MSKELSQNTSVYSSFSCGADGKHEGGIVGCCYHCGQLLCLNHIYQIHNSPQFGDVDNLVVSPLACEAHAGEKARPGLPSEERLYLRSEFDQKAKSKRGKRSGRLI